MEKQNLTLTEQSVRPSVTRRQTVSFREGVEKAKAQVDYQNLCRWIGKRAVADLIVRVMADVYCKPPFVLMVIDGEETQAESVQQIFEEFTPAEAEDLLCKLDPAATVRTKAYVRQCIYNAAIEGDRREE